MGSVLKSIEQFIAALPPSDEAQAALAFLKQPGLAQVAPSGDRTDYHPASHWLRIYRIRHDSTAKAGVTTYGFPSLLTALEKLPPSQPLTMAAFDGTGWLGVFWSDQNNQLIGFVLVAKRTPEEEQERLNWFHQNLT
ncbi:MULTISPECIES: hypothetical protein [unclassified Inquilinus]|uniref:hypothetical protein n=1 Tax=unclassified Inquilinus TaxID=2645927 RepID=UPI003F9218B3